MAMLRDDDARVAPGDADVTPVVFLSALREELAPLLPRVRSRVRASPLRRNMVAGVLEGIPVTMTWSGEGEANARRAVEAIVASHPRSPVIVLGVAGALSPGLAAGDLVLGMPIVGAGQELRPGGALVDAVRSIGGVREGTLLTVDRIVHRAADKANLWLELGRPEIAAVDMESHCFAAGAAHHGSPWVVVRAIVDEASDELPCYLERCRSANGGIDRRQVALRALRAPGTIPSLWAMRRRLVVGAQQLAALAVALLQDERWRMVPCFD